MLLAIEMEKILLLIKYRKKYSKQNQMIDNSKSNHGQTLHR